MCGILCLIQYEGEIDIAQIEKSLELLKPRGPDNTKYICIQHLNLNIFFGFTRLSIMDISENAMQPFFDDLNNYVICNGEIYNYLIIKKKLKMKTKSNSDCEVLLPLFKKYDFLYTIYKLLDAEYSMVYLDNKNNKIYASRDRYGVRPLFVGYNNKTKTIGFASELKALHDIMEKIWPLNPSYYIEIDLKNAYSNQIIKEIKLDYYEKLKYNNILLSKEENIKKNILTLLTNAVKKRLNSDRPIGFLLSGGLDSSLIVSIATKILGPEKIVCFSIGLENSSDIEASKKVVKYLGIKNHHIIPFTTEIGINEIPNVIKTIESYDITTIRASTPQYIMAKYINQKTNIKVILSGEGSDEIHGSYRYFRDAPSEKEFHEESLRLIEELYIFDNLRTDRTMSSNGLEVRVPFLDFEYVQYIKSIEPKFLMHNKNKIEKKIIRDSFKDYLPNDILYRSKEAFSDAVSNNDINWANYIKLIADKEISEDELENCNYLHNKPKTKDALYFRKLFDKFYPGRDNIIPYYWLPKFQKEEILDPSATILKCY